MNQIKPRIRLMTPEEVRTAQLVNAGSVIELEGVTIPIAAGRSDHVHVFQDSTVLYVVSVNYRHEYIGLEVFDASSGEEYNSIFVDGEWELKAYLGVRWMEAAPLTIINRFMEFMN
jgi:hypothetical protein